MQEKLNICRRQAGRSMVNIPDSIDGEQTLDGRWIIRHLSFDSVFCDVFALNCFILFAVIDYCGCLGKGHLAGKFILRRYS